MRQLLGTGFSGTEQGDREIGRTFLHDLELRHTNPVLLQLLEEVHEKLAVKPPAVARLDEVVLSAPNPL